MTQKPVDLKLYFEAQGLLSGQTKKKVPENGTVSKSGSFYNPDFPIFPDKPYNEVFPNVYIGSRKITNEYKALQSLGITHLVNCSMGPKYNQVNTSKEYYEPFNIAFHGIPAIDIPSFKISPFLKDAAAFIDKALNSSGIVYVHCQQGVSRSATVVLAFLMLYRGMDLLTAVKEVRAKRAVRPNDGFLRELCDLQDEINSSKAHPADDLSPALPFSAKTMLKK